jgi:hypothetical protein
MRYYFLALGALMVVCMGCAGIDGGSSVLKTDEYIAPPAAMLQRPGPMVDGPGPGVMGILAQQGAGMGAMAPMSTQVKFVGQPGMVIGWKVGDGFAEEQLVAPGRYDFQQSAIYQLKFSNIPDYPSLTLYPTLEVRGAHPTTLSYLDHNSIPVEITLEDLEHVQSNNMVTKVIYLPDPQHQSRAIAGVETLVSTPLDPGFDPVQKAEDFGTIMLILRVGNKDLEMGGSGTVTRVGPNGQLQQVAHTVYNGQDGQFVPPMPIGVIPADIQGVPSAMIAAGGGIPGQGIVPVAGMGPTPAWGMPMTGTPIGLVGPPHLPYGGPAGLKSHTIRNNSDNYLPEPTDHLLIDVEHSPGYNMPEPVRHIEYSESHPVHAPGEVSHPQSRASQFYGF